MHLSPKHRQFNCNLASTKTSFPLNISYPITLEVGIYIWKFWSPSTCNLDENHLLLSFRVEGQFRETNPKALQEQDPSFFNMMWDTDPLNIFRFNWGSQIWNCTLYNFSIRFKASLRARELTKCQFHLENYFDQN